jgi:hypothetical protein
MSRLRRYWPVESESTRRHLRVCRPEPCEELLSSSDCETEVLPFAELAIQVRIRRLTSFPERARLIHSNRVCPSCYRAAVEVRDLVVNTSSRTRVGIGWCESLLGFRCLSCGSEWSA